MPKKEPNEEEKTKKMEDWDFTAKYEMLSSDLKLLHQIVLLRSDVDTLVYIALAMIPLILAIKVNIHFVWLTTAILLYGLYRHLRKRDNLKHRFEHASTFGVR